MLLKRQSLQERSVAATISDRLSQNSFSLPPCVPLPSVTWSSCLMLIKAGSWFVSQPDLEPNGHVLQSAHSVTAQYVVIYRDAAVSFRIWWGCCGWGQDRQHHKATWICWWWFVSRQKRASASYSCFIPFPLKWLTWSFSRSLQLSFRLIKNCWLDCELLFVWRSSTADISHIMKQAVLMT